MSHWFPVRAALLSLFALAAVGRAADADDVRTLDSLGVKAERDAVVKFLDEVAGGKRQALTAEKAAALVDELKSRDFAERDAATRTLKEQLFPPVAALEAAAKSGTPEQARRARQILGEAAARPDSIAAALRLVRSKKWELPIDRVAAVAEVCHTRPATEAAQDLLADRATPDDEKAVREWLTSKSTKRIAAGVRVLPQAVKKGTDPTGELAKWLGHADDGVRFAAARALVRHLDTADFATYKEALTAESYARLIAAVDRDFRLANAGNFKDEKVRARHGKIVEQYAAALLACDAYRSEKKLANNTDTFLKYGLDTSAEPAILLYRVKWFSGGWSGWMCPGFGDQLMDGNKPEPRNIRCWACFGDHEYEVISATRPDQHRVVVDVRQ